VEGFEDVESVVATVGSGGPQMFGGGGDANVTVQFVDFEDRRNDVFNTLSRLQDRVGEGIAGADVTVVQQEMGPPTGEPISIEIAGEDPDVLRELSERAMSILLSSPVGDRLEGLESDMDDARQELVIDVDREKAALYGLSTAQVGNTIRSAVQGAEAAKFRQGEEEYDIVVRLAERYREDLDAVGDLTVVAEGGIQVPLSSVARWYVSEGAGSVNRKDLDRVVTITSDVVAGANSNAVLGEVQGTLAEAGFTSDLPPGYQLRYTGEQEEQIETMQFLSNAFIIALMLMGFILISQFNSLVKPFIILTSVVMSTVGVLIGLIVFNMPFGIIMTGVGIISLAGVVVNNAIVLIDYIDILRERDGMDRREALVQGGKTRFRPVVLTAITTVLGLIPLAIGLNIDFFGFFTRLDPNLYLLGRRAGGLVGPHGRRRDRGADLRHGPHFDPGPGHVLAGGQRDGLHQAPLQPAGGEGRRGAVRGAGGAEGGPEPDRAGDGHGPGGAADRGRVSRGRGSRSRSRSETAARRRQAPRRAAGSALVAFVPVRLRAGRPGSGAYGAAPGGGGSAGWT